MSLEQGETKMKMRIRLSEDETYEMNMNNEMGMQEFLTIVSKFNSLVKTFSKFSGGDAENEIVLSSTQQKLHKKQDRGKWIVLRDNRQATVDILRAHYLGTFQDFVDVNKKYNIELLKSDISSTQFKVLREIHKINPNEVGVSAFPTRDMQVNKLLLKENKKWEN